MVVHGEREVLPSATRAEAAKALQQFTAAYNKADKAYDGSLDAGHVTGRPRRHRRGPAEGGQGDQSGRQHGAHAAEADGREVHDPEEGGLAALVRRRRGRQQGRQRALAPRVHPDGLDDPWQAAYLTLVAPTDVPAFKTDKDGWAEAVPANSTELAAAPGDLSKDYAAYLKDGGETFADGRHTSGWRRSRAKDAVQPGLVRQYIDEPLTSGDYAPLALRTKDGGALVFFTTRHYQKQTAAAGHPVPAPNKDVLALTKGEIKQSLTMEFVSNEVALDPKGPGKVPILGRIQGMTSAKGE